jgi:CspA family cold shock protein
VLKGKVKTYSPKNGFGFITQDDGDDLFFFKNAFPEEQYGTIQVGARIEYVVVEGQKGPQAAKARVIDD